MVACAALPCNNRRVLPWVLILAVQQMVWVTDSFVIPSRAAMASFDTIRQAEKNHEKRSSVILHQQISSSIVVDELLEQIEQDKQKDNDESSDQTSNQNLTTIPTLIDKLTNLTTSPMGKDNDDDIFNFEDLMGYYDVAYTLTSRPNDNPVGGKWTRSPKFWTIKRTLQHVIPCRNNDNNEDSNAVAQVINVIRLDVRLFRKVLPIWLVLRGDAVPLNKDTVNEDPAGGKKKKKKFPELLPGLSPRTVRAYFDKPRFAIGKRLVFSFGPTSSVVLDTPFVDDRVRIGLGGTSGSKFVFKRVSDSDTEAVNDWKWLLEERNEGRMLTQRKVSRYLMVSAVVSSAIGWNLFATSAGRVIAKSVAASIAFLSWMGLAWALSSTGGIETDGDTYSPGR